MKNPILATESFSHGKQFYFLDFKLAENNKNYISFTRSEEQRDGTFKRWSFIVFENQFEDFINAFSSLFQSAAYQGKGYTTVKELRDLVQGGRGIKSMEPEQRPREKMAVLGREEMSNAELLAMLIGSGTPNETAIELAQRILDSVNGSLQRLVELGIPELCRFKGMGIAKSSTIVAAMELAARIQSGAPVRYQLVYFWNRPESDTDFRAWGN